MAKFRAQGHDVLEQLPTRAEKRRREAVPRPVAAECACQNLPEEARRLHSTPPPDGLQPPPPFVHLISRENFFGKQSTRAPTPAVCRVVTGSFFTARPSGASLWGDGRPRGQGWPLATEASCPPCPPRPGTVTRTFSARSRDPQPSQLTPLRTPVLNSASTQPLSEVILAPGTRLRPGGCTMPSHRQCRSLPTGQKLFSLTLLPRAATAPGAQDARNSAVSRLSLRVGMPSAHPRVTPR